MATVSVGLHSQDGELSRSFTLDSSNPSIRIGRASKSYEARLQAQADNVWIESPILSREHAVIAVGDSTSTGLIIRDTGSTHGTFVENRRLVPNNDYGLKNWDKIVFGTPVTSGRRKFRAHLHPRSSSQLQKPTIPKLSWLSLEVKHLGNYNLAEHNSLC